MVSRRSALMTAAAVAATPVTSPVLAGCGSGSPPPRQQTARPVTYLTGFGTFGREGYAWVAGAKGYFRDAGLRVNILPGAAGDANLTARWRPTGPSSPPSTTAARWSARATACSATSGWSPR
jgi:NitT/TauT family transport system substrate-binding protein